jgi:hypothetical protein
VAELILEPYAVVQHWHLPDADGYWESILGEYLQTIATRCTSAKKCVIGHIKALVLFQDQGYLRMSVIAANIPASIEGEVPNGCTELELTLNVLIYGLERIVIEKIVYEIATEIADQRKGVVKFKILDQPDTQHTHHTNHQLQKENNNE